jgi:indole-3-glycerol phosphate synthase
MAFLFTIKKSVEQEITVARKRFNIGDLKRKFKDAPPIRSFLGAFSLEEAEFGIIGEVKRKSPSAGEMRLDNFNEAPLAYQNSPIVKAVSVITNHSHFGMSINDLLAIKETIQKPVLRKDFIYESYQIYEARAHGADAVLLMVNLIGGASNLKRLYELTRELGMDALIETHNEREIEMVPEGASIYGLNSRRFMSSRRWQMNNLLRTWAPFQSDLSVNLKTFDLVDRLPPSAIKIAESGISPSNIADIRDRKFNAALIGTSLLRSKNSVSSILKDFESALGVSAGFAPSKLVSVAA